MAANSVAWRRTASGIEQDRARSPRDARRRRPGRRMAVVTAHACRGAVGQLASHVATRIVSRAQSSIVSGVTVRRSARVLDRRARPRRDPRRAAAAAGRGRGRRARAVQRHQPRHRGAGVQGPRAGQRVPADARAVSGRRVPGAGQIRLRQRRHGRARAARAAGPPRVRALSASDPLRRARRRPCTCCPTTCRRSARCSPPTSRRRSTACGTRARMSAIASASSAPARSAASSRGSPARFPGCEVELVDVNPQRATVARRARRPVRAPDAGRRRRRPGHPRQRIGRRVSSWRSASPASKRRSSR